MTTLKNILLINALSSGATGAALAVAPHLFAELFEVDVTAPFIGVGLFLVGFAILVFLASRSNTISIKAVEWIVLADSAWVVSSAAILFLQPFKISLLGNVMIAAVAMWVLSMAVLQYIGKKSLSTTN